MLILEFRINTKDGQVHTHARIDEENATDGERALAMILYEAAKERYDSIGAFQDFFKGVTSQKN